MRNQQITGSQAARMLEVQEQQLHRLHQWGLMDERTRKQIRDMAAQKNILAKKLREYERKMNS